MESRVRSVFFSGSGSGVSDDAICIHKKFATLYPTVLQSIPDSRLFRKSDFSITIRIHIFSIKLTADLIKT